MSGVREVHVIEAEAVALLGSGALHADMRIMLASVVYADGEGVARFANGRLQRWLAMPGRSRASRTFVEGRIAALIDQGVLAPGSTPMELRSMLAYGVEADSGEDR